MNRKETIALLYLAKNLYPREKSLDRSGEELGAMAAAWAELLKDVPFELGKAALAICAAGSPFFPTISEIRANVRKIREPPRLSPEEAWQKAIRAVRHFGYGNRNFTTGKYPHEMARESVPPEVWRVMDLLGYRSMCMSENEDVLRAQFIKAWERQEKLREEREDMLPFLPEGLREKFLALAAGEGG